MSETMSQKTFRQSIFMVLLKNLIIDKGYVTITYGEVFGDGKHQWVINTPGSHYICGDGVTGATLEKVITSAWHEAQDEGYAFPNWEDFEKPNNV